MRTVQDHLGACLALARPMPPLDVVLHDAVGCVLAEDVAAVDDLPGADLAAVDGYAVRAADVPGPTRARVLDDVVSGAPEPSRVVPGTCVGVADGALLPRGADAVLALTNTDRGVATAELRPPTPLRPGDGVRARGQEWRAGDVVLSAGTRVGPRQVAVLAAAGLGRVRVHPRPRVVVLPVGNDLVDAGRAGRSGTVTDANGPALAAAVQEEGGAVYRVAAVPDDVGTLREAVEDQLVRADLLLVTGGLGAGREDTVQDVLTPLGAVRFDDVAISPGRRLGVGVLGGGLPVVALPGHPVAAAVAFEVFVRPMLRSMAHRADMYRPSLRATSLAAWDSPPGRRQFVPVTLGGSPDEGYRLEPAGDPGLVTLRALERANAVAVVPEDVDRVALGDELHCLVIEQ